MPPLVFSTFIINLSLMKTTTKRLLLWTCPLPSFMNLQNTEQPPLNSQKKLSWIAHIMPYYKFAE